MSDDTNDFPKLDGGWCDGLGCGRGSICSCGERLAMREEFQRVYNKPWKDRWEEGGGDIDCDRVNRLWDFSATRTNEYHKKEMTYKQTEIDGLKQRLRTFFITHVKDGKICVERCVGDNEANAFVRENDLCVEDDCQVISGGYIMSRNPRSQMWFYKRALNK